LKISKKIERELVEKRGKGISLAELSDEYGIPMWKIDEIVTGEKYE